MDKNNSFDPYVSQRHGLSASLHLLDCMWHWNTADSWMLSPVWPMPQLVESVIWCMISTLHQHGSLNKIIYTCCGQDPPPTPRLLDTFLKEDYLGPSLMHWLYWEPLPPPPPLPPYTPKPPIPPFTLQQHTATRPRCSWIIQAGRQPIALSFVGEDARTKDGQLTEQLWLSRLRWEDNGN